MANNRYRYDGNRRLTGYSSDSPPLMHSLRKWAFWTVVIVGFLLILGSQSDGSTDAKSDSDTYQSTESSADGSGGTEVQPIEPTVAPPDTGLIPSENIETGPDSESQADSIEPSISEIELAVQRAFESGKPVRWANGYAIPSEPEPSTGCRSVYYSIDEREGWQSAARTVCP